MCYETSLQVKQPFFVRRVAGGRRGLLYPFDLALLPTSSVILKLKIVVLDRIGGWTNSIALLTKTVELLKF